MNQLLRTEQTDGTDRDLFISQIKVDVIKNVFAFYDVQHDLEHTTIHATFENNSLKEYVLICTAAEVASVIIEYEKKEWPETDHVCSSKSLYNAYEPEPRANREEKISKSKEVFGELGAD